MAQDKFSNETPEQVVLTPKPRRITINSACAQRAYGLFDTLTGTQVSEFIKGNNKQIVFDNLDPNMHYDVGVIENMGDEKPQFAINWAEYMRDNTEKILNNSGDLPIAYPEPYFVKYKNDNLEGIFNLYDINDEPVGQVIKLSPQGDKPEFIAACSFRMKDDTVKL